MKNIVVVGGSGGLGNSLVVALLDQHYQVVVAGRNPAADPRAVEFYAIDTARTDWAALFQAIERGTGAIDAVVFVSGTAVFGKASAVPEESARETLELNFWACTASAQAAAEYWSAKQRPGRFLAVLSIVARHGVPFEAHYSASKAATARFLECLELEYGSGDIEFISAFPGMLKTPFRSRAAWHGLEPSRYERGADPASTAQALISLLKGSRRSRVIGWRECAIDLADRIWPGLYNRVVLRGRVRKLLESQPVASGGKRVEGKPDTPGSGAGTYSIEARLKR